MRLSTLDDAVVVDPLLLELWIELEGAEVAEFGGCEDHRVVRFVSGQEHELGAEDGDAIDDLLVVVSCELVVVKLWEVPDLLGVVTVIEGTLGDEVFLLDAPHREVLINEARCGDRGGLPVAECFPVHATDGPVFTLGDRGFVVEGSEVRDGAGDAHLTGLSRGLSRGLREIRRGGGW